MLPASAGVILLPNTKSERFNHAPRKRGGDSGATPLAKEISTAETLAKHGYKVEFIPVRSHVDALTKLVQLDATPDAIINGKEWEFKALRGSSHSTVNAILGKAQKKSDYVVLDNSQGSGLSDEEAMAQVLDSFTHKHRHVKEVIFIGKSGKLSYLKK